MSHQYSFTATVWIYPGVQAAWHVVHLPKKLSQEITQLFSDYKRGWGSLPVDVTIGKTSFRTSIFPDSKRGCYLLPLKSAVRTAEHIIADQRIGISITIRP